MALQDIMGPNEIFMLEPSLVRSITEEFSKVFYLYQNFLIWAWFPLYYYYIAILHTIVRVVGGLGVSYLHFTNDRQLYELSRSRGEVRYTIIINDTLIVLMMNSCFKIDYSIA